MKKFTLALTAAALAIGTAVAGVAYAEQTGAMGGMHAKHRMMADPFGDATITRADAQAKATAMFDEHDRNHDGKLDQADRAARIGEHFDKMDANHDGTISKPEFVAAHEQAMGGHDGPGHDGTKMGHGMMGRGMMGHAMKGVDANGDNVITRDECIAAALKKFDAADANHDGKLTKDERRAAMHAHMRERRAKMHGGMGAAPTAAPTGEHEGHAGGHD